MDPELEKLMFDTFAILGVSKNITPGMLLQLSYDTCGLMLTYALVKQGKGRTDEQIKAMVKQTMDITWNNPAWVERAVIRMVEKAGELQKEMKVNG